MGFGRYALGEHFAAGCEDMLQDPGPLGVRVGLLEGFPFVDVVLESLFDFANKFVGSEGGVEGFGERDFVPSGILTGGGSLYIGGGYWRRYIGGGGRVSRAWG